MSLGLCFFFWTNEINFWFILVFGLYVYDYLIINFMYPPHIFIFKTHELFLN